ncbi:hypothetical protein OKW47_001203 [Paraburkholderia atlantica]
MDGVGEKFMVSTVARSRLFMSWELRMPTLLLIGQKEPTAIGKDAAPAEVREKLGHYPELGRGMRRSWSLRRLVTRRRCRTRTRFIRRCWTGWRRCRRTAEGSTGFLRRHGDTASFANRPTGARSINGGLPTPCQKCGASDFSGFCPPCMDTICNRTRNTTKRVKLLAKDWVQVGERNWLEGRVQYPDEGPLRSDRASDRSGKAAVPCGSGSFAAP